ncbi:homoserine kinase [Nakamurella deserti]|uniref:homoserine kinase n=1 Tax=Nakamurella deserti TaxID=2164074 RepID=UPI001300551A|nr:homoserine kinase [Nakamurella deserti]
MTGAAGYDGRQVCVRVPATSANIGPGYDSFGIAMGRYDDVRARLTDGPTLVTVTGVAADEVPRDETHLVVRAAARLFAELGEPAHRLDLTCENRIPHGGGQGSSAAATVAGMLLARELVPAGAQLGREDVLRLATEMEGHPDNVAPTVFGGLTVSWVREDGSVGCIRHEVHPEIRLVVFTAPSHSSTKTTRAMLPAVIPHADAAANSAATAVLLHAMTDDPAYLMDGTVDRLHQSYRAAAMPESAQLVAELRSAGIPAVISGAGASVLAILDRPLDVHAWQPVGFVAEEIEVDQVGAQVTVEVPSEVGDPR